MMMELNVGDISVQSFERFAFDKKETTNFKTQLNQNT